MDSIKWKCKNWIVYFKKIENFHLIHLTEEKLDVFNFMSPLYRDKNKNDKSFRSSHRFCNKGILRNFEKFTGKHLCQSHFFNKAAGFTKFLRTNFLTEHLQATHSKVWKEFRINFQIFLVRYFRIKFCFKCKRFFQPTPEILFMFLN